MPWLVEKKRDLFRIIAPTFIGLIGPAVNVQWAYRNAGLVFAILLGLMLAAGYFTLVVLLLRSRWTLAYLIIDGASLWCSFMCALLLPLLFTGFAGDPPPPMDFFRISMATGSGVSALAGLPTLVLTTGDLKRLWIQLRTLFGYFPKPAPETDPAEFPVTPGWDEQNPKPPTP